MPTSFRTGSSIPTTAIHVSPRIISSSLSHNGSSSNWISFSLGVPENVEKK